MSPKGLTTPDAARDRPIQFSGPMVQAVLAGTKTQTRRAIAPTPDEVISDAGQFIPFAAGKAVKCRFGEIGDRLWVRERWGKIEDTGEIVYAVDHLGRRDIRWRPSYIMPRVGSRMMLQITGRRAERVCEITAADAANEGFPRDDSAADPIEWFRGLWDSLSKPGSCWADNPWVWVIEFRVLSPSEVAQIATVSAPAAIASSTIA